MVPLYEYSQLHGEDISAPFLLVVLDSLFNQLDISSLHVAGVQKLALQRDPLTWSWWEVGQGGSE